MRLFSRRLDEHEAAIRDGTKVEQPPSAKPEVVRFSIGSLTKAKGGRVIHTGELWSKEVDG